MSKNEDDTRPGSLAMKTRLASTNSRIFCPRSLYGLLCSVPLLNQHASFQLVHRDCSFFPTTSTGDRNRMTNQTRPFRASSQLHLRPRRTRFSFSSLSSFHSSAAADMSDETQSLMGKESPIPRGKNRIDE